MHIVFVTGYPRTGKTTLIKHLRKDSKIRTVDVTNQIHQRVFARYNIESPKEKNKLLTTHKDKVYWRFDTLTFRDECIRMGNFMGDKYWMENVIFRWFDDPLTPLVVSSVKNTAQIEYVRQTTKADIYVCHLKKPDTMESDNCRDIIPWHFQVVNDGSKSELINSFYREFQSVTGYEII